jgi:hypothetical protein
MLGRASQYTARMRVPANADDFQEVDSTFSDETIQALAQLGAVFNSIRKRLMAEGYMISDGTICKYDKDND